MKTCKWIILILLLALLLLGALLLHPLVRFAASLYLGRPDAAESVYASSIRGSERLDTKARIWLKRYAEQQWKEYLSREIPFDQAMDALAPLSGTALPQEDIAECIRRISEMETARRNLAQAESYHTQNELALAIPLYRISLMADDGAAYMLQQAETAYKNSILEQAEAAMGTGEYAVAEGVLLEGLKLLEGDDDFSNALSDVRRMEADEAYAAKVTEARRLLREEGPEAAFQYAYGLRQQSPDAYEYEYIEQLVRHEYEDDICVRAQSLQESGDLQGACNLLEEGLLRLDSDRMRSLHASIRTAIPCWLVDMPLLRDDTGDPRTGAISTVARDMILMDAYSNEYAHSFSADLGSVSVSLTDGFERFIGTVAFPYGEKADIYRASATLQIYGDGMLLAEFQDIDGASLPLPFSIPVLGVQELTIRWTSEGANGWKDWGRFATVFDGRLIPPGGN